MEHFVIIVNGWKPLTIIAKSSILGVAAVLDPPLLGIWLLKRLIIFLIFFFLFLISILVFGLRNEEL